MNRAFEWVQLRQFFMDYLIALHLDVHLTLLNDIFFAWSYHPSVSYNRYEPQTVFCNFMITDLHNSYHPCICQSRRFQSFIDPLTLSEKHLLTPISHVRSIDITIIQSRSLRSNLQKGLNHIPLETTWFKEVIGEINSAWIQLGKRYGISEELFCKGT